MTFPFVLFILTLAPCLCMCGRPNGEDDNEWQTFADQVRAQTRRVWDAYREHAWAFDELRPVSDTGSDWYSRSMMMTPIDAIDTLLLMGLHREANEAIALVLDEFHPAQIDDSVLVFEIVIRHVGGLLSAYQWTCDAGLLERAEQLMLRMMPAFDTPTGIPLTHINLATGGACGHRTGPTASGTLIVEMATLSRLTGNATYEAVARRAMDALYARQSSLNLVGSGIDADSGKWTDTEASIGSGSDSYYEYLAKCWSLLDHDPTCWAMWNASLHGINGYLADRQSDGWLWYGKADMFTGERTATEYGALDAFFPAVLALTGNVDRAARLHRSSHRMWTLYGLEPELLDYTSMGIVRGDYLLRPEIIESAWALYNATRDPIYLEMAKTYWEDILARCTTPSAFAEVADVRNPMAGYYDRMQSFVLAETLKYLYLLFVTGATSDMPAPAYESCQKPDVWHRSVRSVIRHLGHCTVFNTEGHPLWKASRPGSCVDLRTLPMEP